MYAKERVTQSTDKPKRTPSVYGKLSKGIGGLKLTVDGYPVKAAERYIGFDTSIPLIDGLKEPMVEKEKDQFSSLPRPGRLFLSGLHLLSADAIHSERVKTAV